jgi:hypothetical protein
MAQFNDVLNAFGDDLPDDLAAKLITAYDEDISIPIAKVNEVEAENIIQKQKIAELKSQNYDLIRNNVGVSADKQADDKADDSERISIDDLFG